jgi:hypothetical protein
MEQRGAFRPPGVNRVSTRLSVRKQAAPSSSLVRRSLGRRSHSRERSSNSGVDEPVDVFRMAALVCDAAAVSIVGDSVCPSTNQALPVERSSVRRLKLLSVIAQIFVELCRRLGVASVDVEVVAQTITLRK